MLRLISLDQTTDGTGRVIMDVERFYDFTWWERLTVGIHPAPGRWLFIGSGGDWKWYPCEKRIRGYRGDTSLQEGLYRLWRDAANA